MRCKKPIVKNLNITTIKEELYNIQNECESIQWYVDTDDETLINVLDGNEDEAYEFKMMFSDLYIEREELKMWLYNMPRPNRKYTLDQLRKVKEILDGEINQRS